MNTKEHLIILHSESVLDSWARDASTFALIAATIGLGWFLDSSAMQWLGAVVAFLTICVRASGDRKAHTLTIPQARVKLDELEGGA